LAESNLAARPVEWRQASELGSEKRERERLAQVGRRYFGPGQTLGAELSGVEHETRPIVSMNRGAKREANFVAKFPCLVVRSGPFGFRAKRMLIYAPPLKLLQSGQKRRSFSVPARTRTMSDTQAKATRHALDKLRTVIDADN